MTIHSSNHWFNSIYFLSRETGLALGLGGETCDQKFREIIFCHSMFLHPLVGWCDVTLNVMTSAILHKTTEVYFRVLSEFRCRWECPKYLGVGYFFRKIPLFCFVWPNHLTKSYINITSGKWTYYEKKEGGKKGRNKQ